MTRARMRVSRAWWRARERWAYRKLAAAKPADRAGWRRTAEKARRRVHQYDRAMADVTTVDAAGIEFLKDREGIVPHLYHDSRGFCTGGVGHLVRQEHCTLADHRKYDSYSEHDWLALFARDLVPYEKAVAGVFKASRLNASHDMFNACVSLAFNIGAEGFKSSTVARQIKAGNKTAAANAFLLWDRPPELLPRRRLERALFLR